MVSKKIKNKIFIRKIRINQSPIIPFILSLVIIFFKKLISFCIAYFYNLHSSYVYLCLLRICFVLSRTLPRIYLYLISSLDCTY